MKTLETISNEEMLERKLKLEKMRAIDCEMYKDCVPEDEIKRCEDVDKGWNVSKDCLILTWFDGTWSQYYIFEGPFTKRGMCRDCETHYEIAIGDTIHRIEYYEVKQHDK